MSKEKSYNRYRWKWENNSKYKFLEIVPIHLDIELTTQCNYRCIMCFQAMEEIPKIEMPLKLVKRIIKEFAIKGGSSIKFVYRGEPLLYNNLTRVIKYAKKKGIIDTIINTNGSLLNETKALGLIESGLDKLVFSVDSCIPSTYKKIRVGGILPLVEKNIRYIQELKRRLNKKSPLVSVQCIIQDYNKDELESGQFTNYWKGIVDVININPLCVNVLNKIDPGELKGFFCEGVYQRMTIRANGDLCLCCGIDSDSKILGNAYIDSIEDIWLGDQFIQIRDNMDNGDSHLIEPCRICDLRINYKENHKNE